MTTWQGLLVAWSDKEEPTCRNINTKEGENEK
jgi:hypothetical protein